MSHTFIAYIDEAGDDGLSGHYRQPGGRGGSSHWLSLGVVVWRLSRDLDAVRWGKKIASQLPQQKRNKILHFANLDHSQRVMAINELSGKPFRSITVLANKTIVAPGVFTEKNQLYFYLCRYLIERISWLCRDMRPVAPDGDGRVKIVFARRGGMSYSDFRLYLENLKTSAAQDIRIHWPVIDFEAIEAFDQVERFGLQIADLVTLGMNVAVEPDYYGNTERRFASILRPNVYSRNENFLSYGAKLVPSDDRIVQVRHVPEFIDLFDRG